MLKQLNKHHLHLFLTGILVFVFYLISMPKTVVLEDDGIFLLSAYFNGISHPPGYPLHSLLGYLFVHLPIGNPAANGHALSALFSALASVLIFLITAQLTANNPLKNTTPYIAVIAFTLSFTIWSQSIITEVYTLNIFLFLSVLYITLCIGELVHKNPLGQENPKKEQSRLRFAFFYLGLFSGLALSNHWPLFILGCLGIIFLLSENYKAVLKHWHLIILGLVIGLTPYIWLYINSNSQTFIQYFSPFENFRDFYAFISREHFNKSIDFSPTATLMDKVQLFIFTLKQLVSQWGPVNSIFVPIGLAVAFSTQYKKQRRNLLAILISYIATSLVLSLILGYDFEEKSQINMPPFFALAHSLGAIFFAIGAAYSINKLSEISQRNFKHIIIGLIVLQAFFANVFINYRHNYNWTTLYAQHVLDTLKPNSTLFVSSDIGTGVIGYWHFIKKYRPDITVIQSDGLVIYGTRLFAPKKVNDEEREQILLSYIKASPNPVYFLYQEFKFGVNGHWIVYEYNKNVKDYERRLLSLSNKNQKYLNYIFSDIKHTDKWTIKHRDYMRLQAMGYLMNQLSLTTDEALRATIIKYIFKTTNNLQGLTIVLALAYEYKNIDEFSSKKEIIELGWRLYDKEKSKATKAKYLNLLARINIESGDKSKGERLYIQSIKIWGHRKNIAHKELAKLLKSSKTQNIKNKKKSNDSG